jgi:hypothetical protein
MPPSTMREIGTRGFLRAVLFALAPGFLLASCAAATTGESPSASGRFVISPATAEHILQYRQAMGFRHQGAFAVSENGEDSFFSACALAVCRSPMHKQLALKGCEAISGQACRLLMIGDKPLFDFNTNETRHRGRHGKVMGGHKKGSG